MRCPHFRGCSYLKQERVSVLGSCPYKGVPLYDLACGVQEPLCLPVVVSVPGSEEMKQEVRHTLSGPTLASLINFN